MLSNYDSPASEEASVLLCCHQAPFTGFWGKKHEKHLLLYYGGKAKYLNLSQVGKTKNYEMRILISFKLVTNVVK